MTTIELFDFIHKNVMTFTNLEIIENGIAFHYTSHWDKIIKSGKFLGAPINKNVDKTQYNPVSPPAQNDPGVVFAYQVQAPE